MFRALNSALAVMTMVSIVVAAGPADARKLGTSDASGRHARSGADEPASRRGGARSGGQKALSHQQTSTQIIGLGHMVNAVKLRQRCHDAPLPCNLP